MTLRTLLSATALASAPFVFATTASAQATTPPGAGPVVATTDATDDTTSKTDIIVTGSRLARPNVNSPVPVTSLSAQELTSTGNISIGDVLNQLPQLRSTFSQANSTRFIGTAGISALDLRGLGNARTLVLVDNSRLITSTPGVNRPDVNNIPTDLIDRIDIVTGGNSAIYGSDAVAGVVNFVLKQDFSGVRLRAQGGISNYGDAGSYFVSATVGKNFGDGRGNIAFSAEYAKQNTLFYTDRDSLTGAYSGTTGFASTQFTGTNLNPSAGALHGAEPSTGDGIPDTSLLSGLRNASYAEGGLYTAACPTVAAAGESAAAFTARRAVACSGLPNPGSANPLSQYGNLFIFQSDGSLTRNVCTADLRPFGSGSCVGGQSSTLRLAGFLQPGLDRKTFNMVGHYEISPAFVPYFRAQFVRTNSVQEGQPTFFSNTFSTSNPFLTTQARATLASILAPGVTTFTANRFDIDFGGRGEHHQRDTYQATGGVRGTFNGDWKYDVEVNYGHLYTFYTTAGNVNLAKYANSINAVRNTAGNIVCGINADAITTNDDAACVPVNLFGNGQPSQAALGYFGYTSSRVQKADLLDGTAYVSGDSSQLFSLPGGPIGFVLGGEIRRETAYAKYDDFTASGGTFLNSIPLFRPPAEVVKEGFAELSIPLLKDLPFARELSVDLAGRVSNYNIGSTGTVYTYNASGIYAPVRDIRFRASYAKAVRAPTQSDLYSPLSQTFLNGAVDPCSQTNINSGPQVGGKSVRIANCAAAGVPVTQTFTSSGATTTEPFTNVSASGISGFNGSNAALQAEVSNSLTVGVVLQPHFIRGLTISVDYYHIEIKNVISSLLAQTIINQCYDSLTGINNPFCAVVFRNANGTFAGQSSVNHAGSVVPLTVTGPSFISGPFNYAKQITSGLDTEIAYSTRLSSTVSFSTRAVISKNFIRDNYTDITNPNFILQQLSNLGDPQWQGNLSANLIVGPVNFGYRFRYIGKQTIGAFETQNSVQGRPPSNPDAFPFIYYPQITYSDVRVDFSPKTTGYKFYFGADNVFNQLPPDGLIGTEGGDPFSPTGRFFYAGVEIKF